MEKRGISPLNMPQVNDKYRSPEISRRNLTEEAITAHSEKKSRRARSNEPAHNEITKVPIEDANFAQEEEQINKRWSFVARNQEAMSKQELINSYRLLMNEKLRLERFLSIMTKNNEMARNRLESDLLDAMMCIEDLKQALEIRMARRRKIDPREAEERRYLIRQNKKLLNQIYESAKKIERLEATKVEMTEQLELLDFQIVEIENQKTMIEEELRKVPPTIHQEIQTEESLTGAHQLNLQLKEQLSLMKSELANQKAESAAALAKQSHLENLVRELRRDNIELRDQLTRLDDVENSLAESDKPIVADVLVLKGQLDEQLERVKDLEEKLHVSRSYAHKLESKLEIVNSKSDIGLDLTANDAEIENNSEVIVNGFPEEGDTEITDKIPMFDSICAINASATLTPSVDSLLLRDTITTFQALLDEKDKEIAQLKQCYNRQFNTNNSIALPKLFETIAQTDICMQEADQLSILADQLTNGGQLITSVQYQSMLTNLKRCEQTLRSINTPSTTINNNKEDASIDTELIQFDMKEVKDNEQEDDDDDDVVVVVEGKLSKWNIESLSNSINNIRQLVESLKLNITLSDIKLRDTVLDNCSDIMNSEDGELNKDEYVAKLKLQIEVLQGKLDRMGRGSSVTEERIVKGNIGEFHFSHSSPSHFMSSTCSTSKDRTIGQSNSSPNYYNVQLQELKQTGDLELARAHLSLSERRRHELERRITEVTDELARSRAEARSAETSLSAARRTEVALRRRLLVAMNIQNASEDQRGGNAGRHSVGATLGDNPEILDIVELQSNLAKLQSINTSLNEAAQLDRAKLHEQAMRIDQLEAELRSQLHRISLQQATETNTQRGIVRLQALYEDMLREYSESKSVEADWTANRQRGPNKRPATLFTKCNLDNNSIIDESVQANNLLNKNNASIPVGSCVSPACVAIRHLLKAFQDCYTEVVTKLQEIQKSQQNTTIGNQGNTELVNTPTSSSSTTTSPSPSIQKLMKQTPELIDQLNKQLNKIIQLCDLQKENTTANNNNSNGTNNDSGGNKRLELLKHFKLCSQLIKSIEYWIVQCLTQTDVETFKLRSQLMKAQLLHKDMITQEDELMNDESAMPYSVETNTKPDVGKVFLNEKDVFELRERLRQTEAKLQLQLVHNVTSSDQ